MRILFLTSRFPFPPDRGDRLRTYQLLRHLSREHSITLVSFASDQRQAGFSQELDRICEDVHTVMMPAWQSSIGALRSIWRSAPLQVLYYQSAAMQRTVSELLRSRTFDLAYVHLFRMAPYLQDQHNLYRILDLTDLISFEIEQSLPYQPAMWRLIYRLELPRIQNYEKSIAATFDETWFISERDRHKFQESDLMANAKTQVIPNGIDERLLKISRAPAATKSLLFVGHLEVMHNIDAAAFLATEILPLVRAVVPGTELQIAGAGRSKTIAKLAKLPGVRVIGFVPDLAALYTQNSIFVAPLRFSAGVQNKVLEAMAAALPVVTAEPVIAGLGATADTELLQANDADSYARHIVALLNDANYAGQLGIAGRDFVRSRYSWKMANDRLRAIGEQLAA